MQTPFISEATMDETTHKQWWPLHIKHALGEILTPDEQAIYGAGCAQLDAEEKLPGSVEELKQARQKMLELKAEYERLNRLYEAMEAKRAERESRLSDPTRQPHTSIQRGY